MQKSLVSLSALLLAAGLSGTALAQNAPSRGQATPPPAANTQQQTQLPSSADISDDDVAQFAKAQKKVQGIKAEYSEKLQKASEDDPKEALQVRQQAQQKMVQAVQDNGMEVQNYNRIAMAAQQDSELRKRIQDQQ